MTTYSFSQLEQLWKNAGGPSNMAPTMAAIAEAESAGNSGAINPTDNHGTQTSWGLWQISNGTHNWPGPNNPLVAANNAQYAVQKYNSQGLTAWGTYDSGAYKQYLSANGIHTTAASSSSSTSNSNSNSAGGCPNFLTDPIGAIICGLQQNFGSMFELFFNPVDAAERIGLVLLGGILIVVGIIIIAFGPASRVLGLTAKTKRSFASLSGSSGSPSGPSEEVKEERKRRLELAERNVALGERKLDFREARESRLAMAAHRKREPNPHPQHS